MKKEMSWKNVLGFKHSCTSVGEYEEMSANTFKWIIFQITKKYSNWLFINHYIYIYIYKDIESGLTLYIWGFEFTKVMTKWMVESQIYTKTQKIKIKRLFIGTCNMVLESFIQRL
jgi:disulfide oxidoreductase YuzD